MRSATADHASDGLYLHARVQAIKCPQTWLLLTFWNHAGVLEGSAWQALKHPVLNNVSPVKKSCANEGPEGFNR